MTSAEFPSNSKNPRSKPEEKNVEAVVTSVVIRQKSLGKRFREMLIGGDSRTALQYVIAEVIIPQIKDMASEAITQGFERVIYGDGRSPSRGRYRPSSSPTNYSRYSQRGNNPVGRATREDRSTYVSPRRNRVDEFVFETRVEAEEVQRGMYDILEEYDTVSVANLMSLVGKTPDHVDHKWGWDSLEGSHVQRSHDGYILNLPKIISLD